MKLVELTNYLEEQFPLSLAEDWDNVGLIIGDHQQTVSHVMTCLTLTTDVLDEAIEKNIDLILTHHPILFRAVKKLTTESHDGAIIHKLMKAGIAVYSPHTAFDSALTGINAQLAETFELQNVQPLRPVDDIPESGSGRWGTLTSEQTLSQFLIQLKNSLDIETVQYVGELDQQIQKVALACGSAGEFLEDALKHQCDLFITGETRFHTALEAREQGIALVLLGHYQSEHFACVQLAEMLAQDFPQLNCSSSLVERDPLDFI